MTIAIKEHITKKYYITMEWDKSNIYVVQVCPRINEILCGYPERKMTYSMNEKDKALATFRRYVKKYGN